MSKEIEGKAKMWDQIMLLSKRDQIVNMAFGLYDDNILEDQVSVLMFIVLRQHEQIKALELAHQRLQSDFYARKSNA